MAAPKTKTAAPAKGKVKTRKKEKKNIAVGKAFIKSTFNNTIISITDPTGAVISWASSGQVGYKGSRKSTPFAAQLAAEAAARRAQEHGLKKVDVFVKGPGSGRETAIRSLQAAGLEVGAISDVTPAARSGLITAVILGIARVVGETAPLLLTIGGADAINLNPTSGNMSAFPYYVWKNLLIGSENAISRAWLGVFVLMILVLIFFALARYFGAVKGSRK